MLYSNGGSQPLDLGVTEGITSHEQLKDFKASLEDILPCPRCGGEVEWTNSRDREILSSYMQCSKCDLSTFRIESMTFVFDSEEISCMAYDLSAVRYNMWCLPEPTCYEDESW